MMIPCKYLLLKISDYDQCNQLSFNPIICFNLLPLPTERNAVCKAQLIRQTLDIPKICPTSIIIVQGYKVQELQVNSWLIIASEQ